MIPHLKNRIDRNHKPGQPADVYQYDSLNQLVRAWCGADATDPGSITEVSDSSGQIVERYEYDVYGAVTIYDGSWVTRTTRAEWKMEASTIEKSQEVYRL